MSNPQSTISLRDAIEIGRKANEGGPDGVVAALCNAFQISRHALCARRLPINLACRAAIAYVLREMNVSYPKIAEATGCVYHVSAMKSYRRALRLLSAA